MSSIRIEDVARRAGVSMKTVSRVLNNEPNVREKTREKVRAAAAEMKYRPNPSARSLAASRSFLLGLLYGNVAPAYLVDLQNGVLETCNAEHYGLVLHPCSASGRALVADIEDFVRQSRVDGLILTPPISNHRRLIVRLEDMGVKLVRISPMEEQPGGAVSSNERQAAADIMRHLIGLGHRRIGFIKGPADHGASHWRLESYLQCLEAEGLEIDPDLVVDGDFSYDSGVAAAARLLDLPHPPTAIFASNDDMAAGVLHVAHDRGLRIPRNLSVAGFDDTPLSRQVWPRLTTVHQPIRSLGRTAATMLLALIAGGATADNRDGPRDGPEDEDRSRVLDYELKIRDSTGPAPE